MLNRFKQQLLSWLLVITWIDVLFILFTYIIYVVIKLPINIFIYDIINNSIIALLSALIVSLFITRIKNLIFNKFKDIIGDDKLENLNIWSTLEVFHSKIISYKFNVVYYHGFSTRYDGNIYRTMPEPSEAIS